MALTHISYFNLTSLRQLYEAVGSACEVVTHHNDIRDVMPDASPRLIESLRNIDEPMRRAEAELDYDQAHGIEPLAISNPRYPQRLLECADAPLVLFHRGNADLNQQRVICMVGTRHSTAYGQDLVRRFIEDLRQLCPKVLIVSGLAYGIDIHAHRNALLQGYETEAVLAHGLDQLYPPRHTQTAREMVQQGGLLTEFFTNTRAEKMNFVRRNRIVAGMSDACILVESAAHGGGLIGWLTVTTATFSPSRATWALSIPRDATISSATTEPRCSPRHRTSSMPWAGKMTAPSYRHARLASSATCSPSCRQTKCLSSTR